MNCIIVDDDKLSRSTLEMLIEQFDFLDLKLQCSGALEAFNFLQTNDIDLVFLDVEMPEMTGLELLKNLERRPVVILVTSKKDYAVEAFELNVADFLIKPINLQRFSLAVSRAKELVDSRTQLVDSFRNPEKSYIFVRHNSILTKVEINTITYIQALGDYINIYTPLKRYTVHCTLRFIEEKLPISKFYRLHRSYLVGLDHIETIEDNTVYVSKHPLPIGRESKKKLLEKVNFV